MGLGVDTVFALAVLWYRKDYPDLGVKLESVIPCRNQSNHWTEESKKLYDSILKVADIVTLVSDEDYKPWLMQKKNIYMVDKCNILLAVWDGSLGGTKNCVDYAKSKNKKIEYINPKYL